MTRTNGDEDRRALLLEVSGAAGVALTPDGRFVRVRCRFREEEGEEIELGRTSARRRVSAAPRPVWRLHPGLVAALGVVLCLVASPFAVGRVLASGDPVAYVSLDVNPSLEFATNRWGRVVAAQGLNSDGEALLAGVKWRGQSLAGVIGAACFRALDLGLLGDDDEVVEVVLAACPVRDEQGLPAGFEQQLERARALVEADLGAALGPGAPPVTLETILADAAGIRSQAASLDLSVGRYAVLLAGEEAGLKLTAEDLRHGLGAAVVAAGGHPGQILRAAHENKQISKLAQKFEERNGLRPGGHGNSRGSGGSGKGGSDDAQPNGSGEDGVGGSAGGDDRGGGPGTGGGSDHGQGGGDSGDSGSGDDGDEPDGKGQGGKDKGSDHDGSQGDKDHGRGGPGNHR